MRSSWRETAALGGFFLGVDDVVGVGAFEVFDAAGVEVPDACGDFVDDVVVVGDEEHGAVIFLQREIEGVDGFEVQVIGGLVEHEHVGLLQHQAAENQARGFAS